MAKVRAQVEANLTALIESTEDYIWSVDLHYGLIAFNRAVQKDYENSFGTHAAVGMRPEQLLPPAIAANWPPLYERALREGPFRVEYSFVNGHILELSLNPIVVDGRTTGVSVFGKDITEHKRAAEALAESEARFRTFFEENGSVMLLVDPSSREIVDANHAASFFYGYPREQLVGMNLYQIDTLTPEELAFDMQQALSKERNFFTYRGRLASGEERDLEVYSSPIVVGGRALLHGIIHDITKRTRAQDALRNSEERYRTAFQMSLDAVNINRLDNGMFVDVNEAFLRGTGYTREEIIGHTAPEVDIWANPEDRQKMFEELRKNSACMNLEAQFRRKNGTLIWGLLSASIIELDDAPCILTMVRDISETKAAAERLAAAQNALRSSEVRYRTAFHASPNAVNIFRLDDGIFLDINPAFLDVMGFERQEVIGRTALELKTWAVPSDLQDVIEELRRNQVFRGEVKLRKKSGETFWGLMSASVFEHEGAICVLSVTQDLTDVKAAQDEIRNLSFYDPLTGLPNRRLLMDRLLRSPLAAARNRRKRALLFVDLDNFKSLNDTLGHQTGDLLLQEVAQRLDSCVRESDTVARCGGDEFAVMLESLSEVAEEAAAQAQVIGEKILAICGLPYHLAGHECHCPSSIGITVFGDELDGTNDALQRAEIAMYQAKEAGRNTIRFFAPALQAAVNARAAMEEDLRQAIKTNQFVLFYQPQVERDHLIGAEALIRWKHPKHGLLPPGEFIPLAEESGLILPLGDWVIEAACSQLATWALRKETAAVTLAVNISARQFRQPDFVERVLAALDRTGANPLTLKLELTESMLLDNVDDVITKITALKSHGLRFSLDDFGTGYSSMAYLRRLPLDELKIDLIFVRDIMADAASGAIAQAILSLGKAMGLRVIAEGVETREQRDFLVRMGCNSFQGFLFSRPLPLEEFQLWLPDSAGQRAQIPKRLLRSPAE
jgi:diguanylate cyclase (GGDEF)-like protein/PAS domain S-box-containing protein